MNKYRKCSSYSDKIIVLKSNDPIFFVDLYREKIPQVYKIAQDSRQEQGRMSSAHSIYKHFNLHLRAYTQRYIAILFLLFD